MKQKGLIISILLIILHHSLPSSTKEIPKPVVVPGKAPTTPVAGIQLESDSELKFFQRIQGLNLDWEDIVGSYKNVSAEAETAQCKSKCKTTIALWVLQNLSPCTSIEKRDCPTGLVCGINCGNPAMTRDADAEMKRSTPKPKDLATKPEDGNGAEDSEYPEEATPASYVPFYNDDETDQLYYPQPILDPIPNDESSEILKV